MSIDELEIGGLESYYNKNQDNLGKLKTLRRELERRKVKRGSLPSRHQQLLDRTENRIQELETSSHSKSSGRQNSTFRSSGPQLYASSTRQIVTATAETSKRQSDAQSRATKIFKGMTHTQRIHEWHHVRLDAKLRHGLGTLPPDSMNTIGSGPMAKNDFDDLLHNAGIKVYTYDPSLETIVVGTKGIDEDGLRSFIRRRAGMTLKIYSQEMMAAWLSCGTDPFTDEVILSAFCEGHPILEMLSKLPNFKWPQGLSAPRSGVELDAGFRNAAGLLTNLGYHVGKASDQSTGERQRLLKDYIEDDSQQGMAGCLEVVARAIAAQIYQARNNGSGDYSMALEDWQSDLDWLFSTYYRRLNCGFAWPQTRVGR